MSALIIQLLGYFSCFFLKQPEETSWGEELNTKYINKCGLCTFTPEGIEM